ncbi:MAG: hypothetical protein ACREDL_21835, partial [Bradyrhizobium sp.]
MNSVPSSDYFIVLVIFTAIAAATLLVQVSMLVGMFIVMRRSIAKFQKMAEEAKAKAFPVIQQAQDLINEMTPKVKTAVANLEEVTHTVRKQASNVNTSVDDIVGKANAQIRRVDEMLTATLNAVDDASRAVEKAVAVPTRRLSGVLNGIRVGIAVFLGNRRQTPRSVNPPTAGPTVVEIPT